MQEGSAELGTGHEDAVGQEEVAEEGLCRTGTGGQQGFQRPVYRAQVYAQPEHPR